MAPVQKPNSLTTAQGSITASSLDNAAEQLLVVLADVSRLVDGVEEAIDGARVPAATPVESPGVPVGVAPKVMAALEMGQELRARLGRVSMKIHD